MPVTYHERTLSTGLTVIAETDPHAHTAAMGFFVRTGARDEAPALMGVSHFLEHMMFKGSDRRTSDDVNREFDALGARSNAYTSSELTAFHAAVLPEHLAGAADILADMMRPALRDDDFNTERGVILEEIAMYKDDPGWVLYERLLEEHYEGHPLAHRVLGTPETINAMTPAQMRAYFRERYSADNTVVALAGRLDFDAMSDLIDRLCSSWTRTGAERAPTRPIPPGRSFELRDAKVTRGYRMMLSTGPGMNDDARYAAWMAAQLLGGPDNSRLHWALVEPGIAEEAEAGLDPRDGLGDQRLSLTCDPERLEEATATMLAEVESLPQHVTPEDLERIKAKVATGVTLAGERPEGRMHRLGRLWAYGQGYTSLEDELARINRVSVHDVLSVIEQHPWTPQTTGTLLPA